MICCVNSPLNKVGQNAPIDALSIAILSELLRECDFNSLLLVVAIKGCGLGRLFGFDNKQRILIVVNQDIWLFAGFDFLALVDSQL